MFTYILENYNKFHYDVKNYSINDTCSGTSALAHTLINRDVYAKNCNVECVALKMNL